MHGVTVLLVVLVVVLQVYFMMEFASLELAVEAVAVDQVVVTTVEELSMVVIVVVTLQDLHRHLLLHLEFWTLPMVVMVLVVDAQLVVVEVVDPPVVSST